MLNNSSISTFDMETIARFEHSYFLTVNGEGRCRDNPCICSGTCDKLREPIGTPAAQTTEGDPLAGPHAPRRTQSVPAKSQQDQIAVPRALPGPPSLNPGRH